MVLVEELSHLGDRSIAIVGDDLTKEQRPVRADPFVEQLFILDALQLACALLDGPGHILGGHVHASTEVDRPSQPGVALRIATPGACRDRDFLDDFRKQFPALGVLSTLAPFNCRPFAVATHFVPVIQWNCLVFKPIRQ